MRSIPLFAAAALIAIATNGARAGDSLRLAEHGGFLLGNAHRCGVPAERVVKAGKVVQGLIAAAAADEHESDNASSRFAEFFVATAYPDSDGTGLMPVCKTVIAEFGKLERHRLQGKNELSSGSAARGRSGVQFADAEIVHRFSRRGSR